MSLATIGQKPGRAPMRLQGGFDELPGARTKVRQSYMGRRELLLQFLGRPSDMARRFFSFSPFLRGEGRDEGLAPRFGLVESPLTPTLSPP